MKSKVYGVTGSIASGKSTVCRIFETLGVPIAYADQLAKEIIKEDESVKNKIIRLLGPDSYHADGKYNPAFVSSIVFNDPSKLQALNAIVHPAVGRKFKAWLVTQTAPYVLYESALLIEAGIYKNIDGTIVVRSPLKLRLQRLMSRDKISESGARRKINSQLSQTTKLKYADFIINNDEKHSLIEQCDRLHRKLLNKK